MLVERAKAGDEPARGARSHRRLLGAAIASLVNIFDPELVVVGGGFGAAAGEFAPEPARAAVRVEAVRRRERWCTSSPPSLGLEAGLVGAGLGRLRGPRRDPLMPLSICATPIGNLDDVTLRVLAELRAADLVLCEDTRRTRILLARHGIDARLESHHRHNEAARRLACSSGCAGSVLRSCPTPGCRERSRRSPDCSRGVR